MTKSLLTLCTVLLFLSMPAHSEWRPLQGGQMPPNVTIAGQDETGRPFHVCRAEYGDGVYPGIVIGASLDCTILFDGSEYSLTNYEVLVDEGYSWVPTFDGDIPFDAVAAGRNAKGDILYVCRGDVDSQWRPGRIHQAGMCIVSYAGKELKAPWYEVLVGN